MCGIAGYLTSGAPVCDRALIRRMTDRLAHRGPDGEGFFVDGRLALGHRRLSIIDLDAGTQPMGNEDGSIQVVFNGEIYNHAELHAGLARKGHRFRTKSDTEVLVHLYEEEGERMPESLNGMFAFAIWDTRRRRLFLARDRFGEKPLYYTFSAPGFRFAFASELKALTALPDFPGRVNDRAVKSFLAHSYIADPETIYENTFRLKPGHSLTVTMEDSEMRRYWTPHFEEGDATAMDARVEEIRALSEQAVSARMMSDVPLGAFLSGGVDSGGVVACMCRAASAPVKTFSIGFTSASHDELPFARLVAKRYETEHHERVVTPDVGAMLDTLAFHYDEPFGDSSAIPTLYLAQMTRERVTVALSGDGADELFGGYRRYRFGVIEEKLRSLMPRWFRRSVVRVGAAVYPRLDFAPRPFRAKATLKCLSQELADAYYSSMAAIGDGDLDLLLEPRKRRELRDYMPREQFRQRFLPWTHLPPLQQMQAVDFETYLSGDILVKVDRATMAYSLESRAPWLDPHLAELAGRLPQSFKIASSQGKYVFKRALEPFLPTEVLTRAKMGFTIPLESLLRSTLRSSFAEFVLCPAMEQFIDTSTVKRIWNEHQRGIRNHRTILWNLLALGMWRRRHGAPSPYHHVPEVVSQPAC